jgi:hypothetical protein
VRDPAEDPAEFARRLTARLEPDRPWDEDAANRADFAAILTGDITPRHGAQVYALHPHLLDCAAHTLIDAPQLLSALAPDTRAHAPLAT